MPVLQVTKQVQRSQEARLGRTAQRWHSGDLIPDSLDPGSVHGDSALCFLSAPTFLPGNGQWEQPWGRESSRQFRCPRAERALGRGGACSAKSCHHRAGTLPPD